MRRVNIVDTDLDGCVSDAQQEPIVLTRNGKAVAIVVATDELDDEQLELGMSASFWSLIRSRRQESTIDRATLEERLKTV